MALIVHLVYPNILIIAFFSFDKYLEIGIEIHEKTKQIEFNY